MPRPKKAPSEVTPKASSAPQNAAGLAAVPPAKSNIAGTNTSSKTDEAAGKPVTTVNPQGGNAGVRSNGRSGDLEAAIRARAYEIWERRGRPQGAGHDDWLQAEREILAESNKRSA